MILDDFDRETLGRIRQHLLVVQGASEREAFVHHAREIELIDRLTAAAKMPADGRKVIDGCMYPPGQKCREGDRCQFISRCVRLRLRVYGSNQDFAQLLQAACAVRERRLSIKSQIDSEDRAACDQLAIAVERLI